MAVRKPTTVVLFLSRCSRPNWPPYRGADRPSGSSATATSSALDEPPSKPSSVSPPSGRSWADPAELTALSRGHWSIGDRPHHVRDVSYNQNRLQNRLRVRNGRLAGNSARLANAAISIVRVKGRFAHMPQANPHSRARRCGKSSTGR